MPVPKVVNYQRLTIIEALGSKCSCQGGNCWHDSACGITDIRCLQLDHINGDGAADRRRLKSTGLVSYYYRHLDEAKEKLQVLCANCNWVKRHNNHEVRNGDEVLSRSVVCRVSLSDRFKRPRTGVRYVVMGRLERIPEYPTFVERAMKIILITEASGHESVMDMLRARGIAEVANKPMSFFLSYAWSKQSYYGSSLHSLSRFLGELGITLDSAEEILSEVHGVKIGRPV